MLLDVCQLTCLWRAVYMCVFAYMYICVCIAIVHIPTHTYSINLCHLLHTVLYSWFACKTAKVCQVTCPSHGPMESLATFMWFVFTTNWREVHLTWESLNSIGPNDSSVIANSCSFASSPELTAHAPPLPHLVYCITKPRPPALPTLPL